MLADDGLLAVSDIYQRFKRCAGGADGAVVGLNGSVRAACLVRVLRALGVAGRDLIDFGAGDGRVLLAAAALGARRARGYELPDNKAHRFLFDAVVHSCRAATGLLSAAAESDLKWQAQDINALRDLPGGGGPGCVYSFWVGMPLETQERILSLCAGAPAITSLAVYRDRKWRRPEDVTEALEERVSARAARAAPPWRFAETVRMCMYGSGEQHEAWIFRRGADHPAAAAAAFAPGRQRAQRARAP